MVIKVSVTFQEDGEMNETDYTVEGYKFNSLSDASAAKEEVKRISYIEAHLNYKEPESVLTIYNKVIANRIFVTPIGYDFMKKIQKFLLESEGIDKSKISPLPLSNMYTLESQAGPAIEPKPKIIPKKKRDELKEKLYISLGLNFFLIIAIIAIFVVLKTASNPNILNYKVVLENRYAEWEKDLTEREKIVREKEQELKISE